MRHDHAIANGFVNGNGQHTECRVKELGGGSPLEKCCQTMLQEIGEDPEREGLVQTPRRFDKALRELTVGYHQSVEQLVREAIFEEDCSEMVVVRGIEFYSMCEHHLLPFFGRAHVAYVPNGKIIGLSKIPRIVNMYARRLQVQERLTQQITNALQELLEPVGVACMVEGNHMCMMMRGVQSQSSSMVTNAVTGCFLHDAKSRDEFMRMIRS
ncbi:MAG: GTP cyclohydrolase I FolE [Bdellovibrionales bacterium]|nr:GTP cyclohydrolase I FolE [Bdellovibrionales bacterium]